MRERTLRNVFTVGGFTALSRALGLVREMLQARLIGAGVEQSAFTLAFALPNMARKLFGEGALTAAFVPVFRGEVESVGLARAARLARAVMTMLFLMLGSAVVLAVAGLLGAQGLADRFAFSPRTRLTLELVTILTPYMLAICGAAFGMGVLNALGRFKASSFMPALLNVLWIAALGALLFLPGLSVTVRIRVVAAVILAGGFVQMLFMMRCMSRAGVSPRPLFSDWSAEKVRLVWRNTAIAALGAGAVQINYMLDQILAQAASPWAAAVVGYAERLMDLPLGIIGVAFGTVLLPTFSKHFARHDVAAARAVFASSVRNQMLVMLPAAVGLFVLASDVTAVIYEGYAFDTCATLRVSRALAVYALGLGFFGYQKSIVPWFQAQGDMKTPLRVAATMVVLNATLNILSVVGLPVEFRHVGLAASTVLCAALSSVILTVLAHRRNGSLGLTALVRPLAAMVFAAIAMGVVLVVLTAPLAKLPRIPALAIQIVAGAAVYFAIYGVLRLRRKDQIFINVGIHSSVADCENGERTFRQ